MRFFCPELEGTSFSQLLADESVNYQSTRDDYQTVTGWFRQLSRLFTRRTLNTFGYANESFQPLTGSFRRRKALQTVAQFASSQGRTITNNTTLTSKTFSWVCENYNQLQSGFWYTVFTESGIQLQPPYRTGSYRGQIQDADLVGRTQSPLTISYEGETGYDVYISADVNYIRPAIIDSTLKSAAVNKARSKSDVIVFQSPGQYSVGDWVQYGPASYVILSRRTILQDDVEVNHLYTAALEVMTTNTFSAADVIPEYDNASIMSVVTVSTTAAYTIGGWEQYLRYTGSGNATWTLPAASGSGRYVWIKHSGTGWLRVNVAESDKIDRVNTFMISYQDNLYGLIDAASGKWEVM